MGMLRRRLSDQGGTVILFTAVILIGLLAMAGFATDMAYMMSAKAELQRAVDAAALAGASKIGLTSGEYPTVRDFSQQFAALNPYRSLKTGKTPVTLARNEGNADKGNIVLGQWANGAFTPQTSPELVNAVQCNWNTTVPTSFLNVIGFPTLPVSATATAVVLPPLSPSNSACFPLPIGVSACPLNNGSPCGSFVAIRFGPGPVAPNSGTWVGIEEPNPTPAAQDNNLVPRLQEIVTGNSDISCLSVGHSLSTDPSSTCGGKCPGAFSKLTTLFGGGSGQPGQFSSGPSRTVIGGNGDVVYSGPGWQMLIPIVSNPNGCAGAAWPSAPTPLQITGWARFVMTQVIAQDPVNPTLAKCVVSNPSDPLSNAQCAEAVKPGNGNWRVVFGYLQCASFEGAPVGTLGGPGTSVVPSPRLVR